jgi:hypothetical protein
VKRNFKIPLALTLMLVLGLSVVPVAHAQFAAVVTDPTSYAWFGKVWASDLSNGVKLQMTITQGATMISQGLQLYNLAMRETTALRNKQWMVAAGALSQLNFGPAHSNWNTALRSAAGPLVAAGVWQEMTKPGATIANRIQIADAFGASMANSLGSCQAAALQNDGAIGQLESVAISMDTLDNTRASLGGLTNMGISQQLRAQQCQQNLQQQAVQAHMLQMMRQRDYDNDLLTTQQNTLSIATSNPRGITNLSAMSVANFN